MISYGSKCLFFFNLKKPSQNKTKIKQTTKKPPELNKQTSYLNCEKNTPKSCEIM